MLPFEQEIGNEILEKYEGSTLFKKQSERDLKVKLSKTNSNFMRDYLSSHDVRKQQDIELAFASLERQGFLTRITSGDIIQEAWLNLEESSLSRFYAYLGRENPKEYLSSMEPLIEHYIQEEGVVGDFSRYLRKSIEEKDFKKAKKYVKDKEELSLVLTGVSAMLSLPDSMMERDFSQEVFHDTKTIMNHRSLFEKVLRDFGEELEEGEDPLEHYGVTKNKAYAYIKHGLRIQVNDQEIDLDAYGEELPLSDKAIEAMEILGTRNKIIMTVENLTTFYELNDPRVTYIYLGGYHNSVRQSLIGKIAQEFPDLCYLHFGDIDPDGFQILEVLRRKTGVNFEPYLMDAETLKKNLSRSKPVNQHDLDLLERELNNPAFSDFRECLLTIKETKRKLEQETLMTD